MVFQFLHTLLFFLVQTVTRNVRETKIPPGGKIQKGCIYTTNYTPSSGNQCTMFGNCQAKWLINN